ncbi:hypothetical protein BASA61_008656 [Batrachochytrium salamandrivorans]|nr:hypothetical protein BASA61_008656 [Batrachochytrium salamandrivorans]
MLARMPSRHPASGVTADAYSTSIYSINHSINHNISHTHLSRPQHQSMLNTTNSMHIRSDGPVDRSDTSHCSFRQVCGVLMLVPILASHKGDRRRVRRRIEARRVGMSNRDVQVWFQNRRAKKRRLAADSGYASSQTTGSNPHNPFTQRARTVSLRDILAQRSQQAGQIYWLGCHQRSPLNSATRLRLCLTAILSDLNHRLMHICHTALGKPGEHRPLECCRRGASKSFQQFFFSAPATSHSAFRCTRRLQ